ncbi:hypothetical protein DL768_006688 [Monosporascus sp. mg162]|nr:hypothetical protein DL768_006688 [Monosporascus sp. mg162]
MWSALSLTQLALLPTAAVAAYSLREVGARNTLDWRIWLESSGKPVSFWHDVPLFPDEENHRLVNMVVEIPRWTDGKIELKRSEPLNPIFHDDKNKKPRFVESVWPHKSYPFLYGSLPQTWESPNFNHNFTNEPGDNDPMDVFDIGGDPGYVGQIKQVKILGGLALNDGGETDWKVLSIDVHDPLSIFVNSFEDIEKYRPGLIKAYFDWFTYYKVARGDGVLPIVGDAYQDAAFMQGTIEESHGFWQELVRGEVDSNEINYNQTSIKGLGSYISKHDTTAAFDIPSRSSILPLTPKPDQYDRWYYLDEDFNLIELE